MDSNRWIWLNSYQKTKWVETCFWTITFPSYLLHKNLNAAGGLTQIYNIHILSKRSLSGNYALQYRKFNIKPTAQM